MTKEHEALKLALEALETCVVYSPGTRFQIKNFDEVSITKSIKAIKEALAQTSDSVEQEPLEYWNAVEGWVKIDEVRKHFETVSCGTIYKTAGEDRVPLYAAPPKRQPLTDEQIDNLGRKEKDALLDFIYENGTASEGGDYFFKKYARVILAAEAKLKEKNT